jgi:hypothetical protein
MKIAIAAAKRNSKQQTEARVLVEKIEPFLVFRDIDI